MGREIADDGPWTDIFPLDKLPGLLPFGFLYGWWRGLATLTGAVVGGGLQASGLW